MRFKDRFFDTIDSEGSIEYLEAYHRRRMSFGNNLVYVGLVAIVGATQVNQGFAGFWSEGLLASGVMSILLGAWEHHSAQKVEKLMKR